MKKGEQNEIDCPPQSLNSISKKTSDGNNGQRSSNGGMSKAR